MNIKKIILIVTISLMFIESVNADEFFGKFEQGSFILGKTNPKAKVQIDKKNIRVSKGGFLLSV